MTLANLELVIGAGAPQVRRVLCPQLEWVSPEAPAFSRGQSALGPAGGQVLCPVLVSGSISEEVVTAAGLPCWVPHRPQEGWL